MPIGAGVVERLSPNPFLAHVADQNSHVPEVCRAAPLAKMALHCVHVHITAGTGPFSVATAARKPAPCFAVIASCKRCGIEPFAWFHDGPLARFRAPHHAAERVASPQLEPTTCPVQA
jgi:hypothetical protein